MLVFQVIAVFTKVARHTCSCGVVGSVDPELSAPPAAALLSVQQIFDAEAVSSTHGWDGLRVWAFVDGAHTPTLTSPAARASDATDLVYTLPCQHERRDVGRSVI